MPLGVSALQMRKTVWRLAGFHILAFADRFVVSPLAAPIEHRLHLSDAGLGVAMGPALILPYVAGVYLLGRRLRPDTAETCISLSLLVCALAGALGALANGSILFLLSRGVLGLGEAGFDAAAFLLLANAPAARRGRAFGLFIAGSMLGKALALGGGGVLLNLFGGALGRGSADPILWRLVMLSFAALTGAAALVRAPGFGSAAAEAVPAHDGGEDASGGAAGRRLALMIPMGAGVFISQAFAAFAPLALARRYGLTPAHAGELLGGLLLVLGVVGSRLGGEVAARTRRPGGAVLAAPLLVVLIAAAALRISATALQAVSCMALIVLALAILAPLGLDHLQRATPPARRSRVLSAYLSAATLFAFGLAPPCVGLLSARLHGAGAAQTAICAVVGLAALVGLAGALGLRRPLARPRRRPRGATPGSVAEKSSPGLGS